MPRGGISPERVTERRNGRSWTGGPSSPPFPLPAALGAARSSTTRSDARRSPPHAVSRSSACRPAAFRPRWAQRPAGGSRLRDCRAAPAVPAGQFPAPGTAPSRAPHGVAPLPPDPAGVHSHGDAPAWERLQAKPAVRSPSEQPAFVPRGRPAPRFPPPGAAPHPASRRAADSAQPRQLHPLAMTFW